MNFLSRNLLVRRGSGRGRDSLYIPKFFLDSAKYVSPMIINSCVVIFCIFDASFLSLKIGRPHFRSEQLRNSESWLTEDDVQAHKSKFTID